MRGRTLTRAKIRRYKQAGNWTVQNFCATDEEIKEKFRFKCSHLCNPGCRSIRCEVYEVLLSRIILALVSECGRWKTAAASHYNNLYRTARRNSPWRTLKLIPSNVQHFRFKLHLTHVDFTTRLLNFFIRHTNIWPLEKQTDRMTTQFFCFKEK